MLMPEAVFPLTVKSMTQTAALELLKVAISVLLGTRACDQLAALFQLPNMPAATQVLTVAGTQRSSRASSRGRKNERFFWYKQRCLPRFLPRVFLALNIATSCAAIWFLSWSQGRLLHAGATVAY